LLFRRRWLSTWEFPFNHLAMDASTEGKDPGIKLKFG
jgi:hypothetical protein